MEREALKLALEALEEHDYGVAQIIIREALAQPAQSTFDTHAAPGKALDTHSRLPQPAQEQWNAALDEAALRIGEIKGFGQATQDSFAVYIKGLKK